MTISSYISGKKWEMPDEIKVDSISKEMQQLFKEYGEEVNKVLDEEITKVSKETVSRLKKTSPKQSGDYAKGWKQKTTKKNLGIFATVYNSTHGWLVHLLEHGHAKLNGGRTKAEPHVKPAENWAEKELVKRVKEKLSK